MVDEAKASSSSSFSHINYKSKNKNLIKKVIGFFSGSPIGYLSGSFFAGSQTGQSGLINPVIFNIGDIQIHLHHWLISFMVLLFTLLFLRKKVNFPTLFLSFSVGVMSGLILQGIFSYNDWRKVFLLQG